MTRKECFLTKNKREMRDFEQVFQGKREKRPLKIGLVKMEKIKEIRHGPIRLLRRCSVQASPGQVYTNLFLATELTPLPTTCWGRKNTEGLLKK